MIIAIHLHGIQECLSQNGKAELKFEQFLALALKNDLTLALAQQKLEASQADLRYSKTRKLPKLFLAGYSGAAQYQGGIPVANGFSLPLKNFELHPAFYGEAGLSLRQDLFDNQQTKLEIQEKAVVSEKVKNEMAQARLTALFRSALVSCQFNHAEEKIGYLKEQLKLQEQLCSQAKNYLAAGLISRIEIERIEQQLFELQDRLRLAKLEELDLMREIHYILDAPENQLIYVEAPHHVDFLRLCLQAKENYRQETSLELRNAEFEADLGAVGLKRARKHNTFHVNLESYLRYSSSQSWAIGIGIYWPLWDAGERTTLIELAETRSRSAQINFEIRKRQIEQKIARGFSRLMLEHERLESLRTRITELQAGDLTINDAHIGLEENLLKTQKQIELLGLSFKRVTCEASYHLAGLDFLKETDCMDNFWRNEK